MDFAQIYNAIEAAWWIGLGIALFVFPIRPDSAKRRRALAGVLMVFGLSDVIEIWSGAWWRPWWLAVLKFGCGFAITILVLLWFRRVRRVSIGERQA
ncbi:MAG: hypothetical protein M3552_04405 [Planctomycetota bacterium]|nr:hypothetical protein [Planctomycetaceae bacterium]MDQ3329882.1 hypothetical protein [Planctomycetota bacterium]